MMMKVLVRAKMRVNPNELVAGDPLLKKEWTVFHGIVSTSESHWGKGQTGIGLREDGSYEVSLNRPKNGRYPTHRSLDGFSAIYSFGYASDKPCGTIWLYPDAEKNVEKIKKALKNLMGKYGMCEKTKVKSNVTRKTLFKLGDL